MKQEAFNKSYCLLLWGLGLVFLLVSQILALFIFFIFLLLITDTNLTSGSETLSLLAEA